MTAIRSATLAACLLGTALLSAAPAQAELPSEIRIYDDGLDEPGEWGLEFHVSRTLKRSARREDNGELPTTRGLRLTPELSYGVNETTEVSILLPFLVDSSGTSYWGGQQLQLKWLPIQAGAAGGMFAGVNWELFTLSRHFGESRNGVEIRPIVGYRDRDWTLIANLLTSYDLTRGYRAGGLNFSPAFKVARTLTPGLQGGFEYYAEVGRLAHFSPRAEQEHTLYLTADVEREGWSLNLGLGRGLNAATDPWIVKAIVEFSLGE